MGGKLILKAFVETPINDFWNLFWRFREDEDLDREERGPKTKIIAKLLRIFPTSTPWKQKLEQFSCALVLHSLLGEHLPSNPLFLQRDFFGHAKFCTTVPFGCTILNFVLPCFSGPYNFETNISSRESRWLSCALPPPPLHIHCPTPTCMLHSTLGPPSRAHSALVRSIPSPYDHKLQRSTFYPQPYPPPHPAWPKGCGLLQHLWNGTGKPPAPPIKHPFSMLVEGDGVPGHILNICLGASWAQMAVGQERPWTLYFRRGVPIQYIFLTQLNCPPSYIYIYIYI